MSELTPLLIRPIEPEDKRALKAAFSHLSDESRYRRFLSAIRRLGSRELRYLTEVDHERHEALVALTPEGEIVGVARYVRLADRPGAAEVAVTVVDAWQRRGVGTTLLHTLAELAQARGVETFVALCLAGSSEMLNLFRELGASTTIRRSDAGTVDVEVALPTNLEGEDFSSALHASLLRELGGSVAATEPSRVGDPDESAATRP